MSIVLQVAIGLASIAVAFIAGRAWERAKLLFEHGFIRKLIAGHNRVQIVVSNVEISRFKFTPQATKVDVAHVQVPRNVLYMPMPEGRAVAELASLLHEISPRVRIQLVTSQNHDPEVPTFSVGGPSVNALSGKVLKADFPEFGIEYPATRRARYGGQLFETRRDGNNMLTGDYGFIFFTRTAKGAPCLVFCGIRAFGTAMAVDLFRKLPARSEAARLLRRGQKSLIVAEGTIEGLEEGAVGLAFCREIHNSRPASAWA